MEEYICSNPWCDCYNKGRENGNKFIFDSDMRSSCPKGDGCCCRRKTSFNYRALLSGATAVALVTGTAWSITEGMPNKSWASFPTSKEESLEAFSTEGTEHKGRQEEHAKQSGLMSEKEKEEWSQRALRAAFPDLNGN